MATFYRRHSRAGRRLLAALALLPAFWGSQVAAGERWPLMLWDAPQEQRQLLREASDTPLATRGWRLCAIYPHLKDGYWLAVNYGMKEEARRLGVGLEIAESGGYHNLEEQRQQVSKALDDKNCHALLLGTVSYDGLNDLLSGHAGAKPVLALANDIAPAGVQGKIGVPWQQLGLEIGRWLAERHPAGTPSTDIAWFLGPQEAGWVGFLDAGFREGIAGSAINVAVTKWGDTGRLTQRRLVEEALEEHPGLRYLAGTAVMAEVAIAELRHKGLQDRIGLVSSYMTPGAYGGLSRGRILAAVSDFPVLQGKLAVQQAVSHLEGVPARSFIGPEVSLLTRDTMAQYPARWILPPAGFTPIYTLPPNPALPSP